MQKLGHYHLHKDSLKWSISKRKKYHQNLLNTIKLWSLKELLNKRSKGLTKLSWTEKSRDMLKAWAVSQEVGYVFVQTLLESKVHSLINKITFKKQIGINSICQRSMIFSDSPPSNNVKLKNISPTLSNFRPLFYNSSVATTVINNFNL